MASAFHLAEYLGTRAAIGLARALPSRTARSCGARLGAVAWRLGARREIVRDQIAAAFPDRDAGWVEQTAAGCYRHFGREAFVAARLARDRDSLLDRVEADPAADGWIARMAAGEGVVVVSGHLGNWELAGTYLARRGVPLSAVVKRQRNRRFDEWLMHTRRNLGMDTVHMHDSRVLPALLAGGRTVVLIADQDARRRGLIVTFFGRPASTFRGPVRLALRTGAPLVFASLIRDGDGYRMSAETVWEASGQPEPAPEAGELELTGAWVGALERRVRESPAQYFWFHRRWKSEGVARRNEHGAEAVPQADAE